MNILVTGGAGYIGSHVTRALSLAGHECFAYDNLTTGHASAVDGELIVADVSDSQALEYALRENGIQAVIHLAAFIEVGQSVLEPGRYFRNNTANTLNLLETMRKVGVRQLIYSSTAAVYGLPQRTPIQEADPLAPINPYGASKVACEYMLQGYARAHEMAFVSLRYFNVAGADPSGEIGEDHDPETHLVPIVLQVAMGKRPAVQIFGDDYDTPDGTCIRDYIHVSDLAAAHVLALDALVPGQAKVYNLGNGEGFSVREVIQTSREVTGAEIPVQVMPRRAGDPPRLVASAQLAAQELGWQPKYPYLKEIVEHAWDFHRAHPHGLGK